MGAIKLTTASSGSVILNPANTASDVTITVPAVTGTMLTTASTFGATGPAFQVWKSSSIGNTTVPNGVGTKVTFDTETFDTNSNFASSRFTPTVAGYYMVTASLGWNSASTTYDLYIVKNGSLGTPDIRYYNANVSAAIMQGSYMFYMNGTTDYLEVYAYQGSGGSIDVIYGQDRTWFSGFLVRAA